MNEPYPKMRAASGPDFLSGVAQLDVPPGEHSYVPYVLPVVDAHASGLLQQRVRSAKCEVTLTSTAAGRVDGQLVIRPKKGFALRILRVQAFVQDPGAAVDWLTTGERVVNKIIIGHGHVGPYSNEEIDLEAIAHVNSAAGNPEAPPVVKASPPVFDLEELASGTGRITYEPANGLVIARPLDGDTTHESDHGLFVAYSRTAGAGAELDHLVAHVTYHAVRYGAYPPR